MIVGQVEVHSFLKAGHKILGNAEWDVRTQPPAEAKARINPTLYGATLNWSREDATTPSLHSISITSRILPAGDTIEVVGEGGSFIIVDDVLRAVHAWMRYQRVGESVQWRWYGLTPGSQGDEWNLVLW